MVVEARIKPPTVWLADDLSDDLLEFASTKTFLLSEQIDQSLSAWYKNTEF